MPISDVVDIRTRDSGLALARRLKLALSRLLRPVQAVDGGKGSTLAEYAAPVAASLVAKWFILRARSSEAHDLDNLKLQKLLFLAHSRYLATHDAPLIREPVEAWKHGPVVSTVYHEFKSFVERPIEVDLSEHGPWERLSADIEDALVHTWTAFGVLTGWRLRDLTHELGPWEASYAPHARHVCISNEEIRAAWPSFDLFAADHSSEDLPAVIRLRKLRERAAATTLPEGSVNSEALLSQVENDSVRKAATALFS